MNRIVQRVLAALLASIVLLCATGAEAAAAGKRVIYYYQTQYHNGQYVSLSPLLQQLDPRTGKPKTTDIMVAAFHLGYNADGTPYIHLNDNVPEDPMFDVMWQEAAALQAAGVTVRMMIGGAAQGSFQLLFSEWDTFYPILKSTLQTYGLQGIDLDVEESVSLADIQRLMDALDSDFGDDFIITLSPVASALWGGANLSGFDYLALYASPEGARIAWFNGQFYSGFATLSSPDDYERIVAAGIPPEKVVGGMIGNPDDGGGYVPIASVAATARTLADQYPRFGGVASWEYYNTLPGDEDHPEQWAAVMTAAMR